MITFPHGTITCDDRNILPIVRIAEIEILLMLLINFNLFKHI